MKNRKRKIWRKQAKAELSAVFIANLNEKDDKNKDVLHAQYSLMSNQVAYYLNTLTAARERFDTFLSANQNTLTLMFLLLSFSIRAYLAISSPPSSPPHFPQCEGLKKEKNLNTAASTVVGKLHIIRREHSFHVQSVQLIYFHSHLMDAQAKPDFETFWETITDGVDFQHVCGCALTEPPVTGKLLARDSEIKNVFIALSKTRATRKAYSIQTAAPPGAGKSALLQELAKIFLDPSSFRSSFEEKTTTTVTAATPPPPPFNGNSTDVVTDDVRRAIACSFFISFHEI